MDWLDLLAVQGTHKSLLQHHSSEMSILPRSAFFIVQLSHPYMTTGETIALTRRTFVGKVMSLLFIYLFFSLHVYLFIYIYIYIFFYWRLIILQYYIGWFCHTLTWICPGCTWVSLPEPPSHPPPPLILPLGHPRAPALSIMYHASNLDWWFVSHMIIYMLQCHSPKSSHPHPLPQSPKDFSIHLCLFCCLLYRVIISIFLNSIYTH